MEQRNSKIENIKQKIGVVQLELPSIYLDESQKSNIYRRTSGENLEEAVNLSQALDFDVVYKDIISIRKPNARTVIGKGKLSELKTILESNDIEVLFINFDLSPAHQSNLEKDLDVKVIDRTGLILEIFSQRAKTKTGRLQVELARLMYEQTRLVRTWTHLERQRGGLGKTGGPGERQIEIDRRLIRDKIAKIKRQLKEVEKTRVQHTKQRKSKDIKVVSLVGYTNSGKSTLFNALTDAGTLSKDMLFATLDPLMRKVKLPSGDIVILSDTVGFISNLPHELVESFKSTLQEVLDSDLLLHVQDVASLYHLSEKNDVEMVLESIKAENIPRINVLNKIDLLEEDEVVMVGGVPVSALEKQGLKNLLQEIEKALELDYRNYQIKVRQDSSEELSFLYKYGKNVSIEEIEETDGALYSVSIKMKKKDYNAFVKKYQK